jgi:hypothetical protein
MSDQMPDSAPQFLTVGEGEAAREIAMLVRPAQAGNEAPALVWLSGYRSDMSGIKAVELDGLAAELGLACIRLDYSGHGLSGDVAEDDRAIAVLSRGQLGVEVAADVTGGPADRGHGPAGAEVKNARQELRLRRQSLVALRPTHDRGRPCRAAADRAPRHRIASPDAWGRAGERGSR